MTELVVDASAAVKWFFEEDHAEEALRLLDDRLTLHAPDFMLLEVDSVVSKRVRRGLVVPRIAALVRGALRQMPVQLHDFEPLVDPAFELSLATGASVYDCLYVALGELLDGQVVTADRRLIAAIESSGLTGRAIWLGDLA